MTGSHSTSRRKENSRGSIIVETGLTFIVFFGMLIGAFDFRQFLFVHQALVERTRSAARWGAVNDPTDSASITNMLLYNQATAPPDGSATYLNVTAANVTVTNPDSGTDKYRLNIQVSGYSYTVLSPFIGGNFMGLPVSVSVPLGLCH
jgi:Flp pilus assembly protein TadG